LAAGHWHYLGRRRNRRLLGVILHTAYLYSDETGNHTGGKYFTVAGVVFATNRKWNRHDLLQAESVSMKEKKDWHSTKNIAQRIKYIEVVLQMPDLQGRVFYCTCRNNQKNYWELTVDSLELAIKQLCDGCVTLVHHQGFNASTRDKLRKDLKARGLDVKVIPGDQSIKPEVRLADALCGFIGVHEGGGPLCAKYPELPAWFVDLKKQTLP
jgi:hypothetical protein